MATGFITFHKDRVIGVTKEEVKIITPDVVIPSEIVWFTNISREESKDAHFIGDKTFGKNLDSIEKYRALINALEKQFVKPFGVTNEMSLYSYIKSKIGIEIRTLSIPPEHIKNQILTSVNCPLKRAGGSQTIETKFNLSSYRIPTSFGNFKVSTHRAGTKIGIYFCSIFQPKGLAGTILPPGDYWLTHIQIKALREYFSVAIKESYTYHQPKQKDVSLREHESFKQLFGRGYNNHKITQTLVEDYLHGMPGIKQGTINPISVMIRSQRWIKSFRMALTMAESGLEVYRVDYNQIVVES